MGYRALTINELIELQLRYLSRVARGRSVGKLSFTARAAAWALMEHGEQGLTITELAAAVGCSVHAASRAARCLQKADSLRYLPAADDRRVHRVALTAAGRGSILDAAEHYADLFRERRIVKRVTRK